MNSIVQSTIELNNHGVEFFENGMYDDAAGYFCKALEAAKRILSDKVDVTSQSNCSDQGMDEDQQSHYENQSAQCPAHADSAIEACSGPFHLRELNVEMAESYNDEGFIYRNAFRIAKDGNTIYPKAYYAVTCMFNLALAHHLWGLEQKGSFEASLQTATRLYELSYSLLMQEDVDLESIFTLAIVNNLGQAHHAMEDDKRAEQCFNHLLSTLMFFSECGDFEHAESIEGFLSSVMRILLNDPLTAAAA